MTPYIEIERPPVLRGPVEEQMQQLRRYLERVTEAIENAVNTKGVTTDGGEYEKAL